ncbi:MAG: hypothetical protein PWR25_1537 [Euryarchaeota archaeon]|jgi:hypothetical protein|nr:hypothetical protein [Euryarchaeota archaeon]MDN5339083.1 hypothetical protein [Euryarchaeota archaeon]
MYPVSDPASCNMCRNTQSGIPTFAEGRSGRDGREQHRVVPPEQMPGCIHLRKPGAPPAATDGPGQGTNEPLPGPPVSQYALGGRRSLAGHGAHRGVLPMPDSSAIETQKRPRSRRQRLPGDDVCKPRRRGRTAKYPFPAPVSPVEPGGPRNQSPPGVAASSYPVPQKHYPQQESHL